jgi:glyoxylase-like metal-dependent hydrolase (beta-lactamase superfamily II)
MTTAHVLHDGYARSPNVGSSVGLDPGMVARRTLILEPLVALGVQPDEVTHVVLSHHHPDHTMNVGLFPNAEVIDFGSRYRDDLWLDHDGDGWQPSPRTRIWLTPGHTDEDLTLLVEADGETWAFTHLWWRADRTPRIDPYARDQRVLDASRARVHEVADVVVPGHGPAFRVR